MAIVDVTGAAQRLVSWDMNPLKLNHTLVSHKSNQAVMVQMNRQGMSNQAGGHRIGDTSQVDGAAGCDFDREYLIVRIPIVR
jgi:hypothetical protein